MGTKFDTFNPKCYGKLIQIKDSLSIKQLIVNLHILEQSFNVVEDFV